MTRPLPRNRGDLGSIFLGPGHHQPTAEELRATTERIREAMNSHAAQRPLHGADPQAQEKQTTMAVRLKFRVTEVAKRPPWSGKGAPMGGVKLGPVGGDTAENKAFYNATPGGSIEFTTVNAEAIKQFEPGDEFYVTLEKAESSAADPEIKPITEEQFAEAQGE